MYVCYVHTFHSIVIINVFMDCLFFQWECKSDMDNAYRFGSIEVTCEGYDYPEDSYVLKGSCGVSEII